MKSKLSHKQSSLSVAMFMLLVIAVVVGVAVFSGLSVNAATYYDSISKRDYEVFTYGSYNYVVNNDEKVIITKYNGSASSVSIPSTINGKKVVQIAYAAFAGNNELRSVTIPNTVIAINEGAFCKCERLSNINVPDSVVSVGRDAFSYTQWLKNQPDGDIYIGKVYLGRRGYIYDEETINIKSGTKVIADYALYDAYLFSKVNIPGSVKYIGEYAFYNCNQLKSVNLPGVEVIQMYAFAECDNLKTVTASDTLSYIGVGAFYRSQWVQELPVGNVYLGSVYLGYKYDSNTQKTKKSVTIKSGTKMIAPHAFSNFYGLQSVTIPNSVVEIGPYAFQETGLKNVVIPDSIEIIETGTFKNSSIQSIKLSSKLKYIEDEAFYGCNKLVDLVIPEGVKEIRRNAFVYTELNSLTIPPSVTDFEGSCGFQHNDPVYIYGKAGSEAERFANNMDLFFVSIYKDLSNKSKVSSTKVYKGDNISITCDAEGGNGPYKYMISYRKSTESNAKTVQNFSSNEEYKLTMNKAGTFIVSVTVKDVNGKTVTKNFTVNVIGPIVNTSVISAKTIDLGGSVKVTAGASGGTGGYKYRILYSTDVGSTFTTVQDYGTNKTVTITPKNAGSLLVYVYVRDSEGKSADKSFNVVVNKPIANNSSLSSSVIKQGGNLTVYFSASGGKGGYQYASYYKNVNASDWISLQNYSTKTQSVFTPKSAGRFIILTKVKDSAGKIAKKEFTVTVNPLSQLTNTSYVSASKIKLSSSVTAYCSASNGQGSYQYAVYYKKNADANWSSVQNYSTKTSVVITPKSAGSYNILIKVKDGTGKIAKKEFALTVEPPTALYNTSTLSSSSIKQRGSVTVYANASGGQGGYQYAVYYKNASSSDWIRVQDYSTQSAVSITLKSAGNYNVLVKAKDRANQIAKKELNVTVTA